MFFILAILISLTLALYVFLTYHFDYWFKLGVPSPASCVLLGDLRNEFLRKQHVSCDIDKIYNEFKGKTPYAGIIRGRWPNLLILNTDVIKDVLIRNFNSFCNTELSFHLDKSNDPLHAQSLFGLNGEEWREKRAEAMPAFTNSNMINVVESSQENISNLINLIHDHDEDEPIEAYNLSKKLFLEVIGKYVYRAESDDLQPIANEMLLKPSKTTFFKILVLKAFPFLKDHVKIQFSSHEAQNHVLKLTQRSLESQEEISNDFVDFLIHLKNKKETSDVKLISVQLPFLSHGLEILSIALSHTFYEIAKNDRIQEKLRDEVTRHCNKEGKISFDSLQEMDYLEKVFYESLRLHPPMTSIARICNETIGIDSDGKRLIVEEGIRVIIPIKSIHHDSEIFMEPQKFHPERFDYTLKSNIEECLLLPFGEGSPRSCLGKNFSLILSKLTIAMIVKNFKITVNKKTNDNPLMMDPNEQHNIKIGGVWLNFEKLLK